MSSHPAAAVLHVPSIIPVLNRLIQRLIGAGMPFGPNVLITIRGRRTGEPRTFPIAILELGERRYVQSPFGEVNWVRNLRASGEATIMRGAGEQHVSAVELAPEDAAPVYHDALAPYFRIPLVGRVAARYFRLDARSTPAEYLDHARTHPMFELLPLG
jgi:deazaflavin-dependent oxidoreductase (nitroreductase family)